MTREADVVRSLVEMADTLVDDYDVDDLLTGVADRCVHLLGVSAAGVMLASPAGSLGLVASSSEAMRLLELFELQQQEGPCLDAFRTGEPVQHENLQAGAGRWPSFSAAARKAGFAAASALPLRLRDVTLGALNLLSVTRAPMDQADVIAARAFADLATLSITQHRASAEAQILNEQLSGALTSRVVIEQAKGVISERADTGLAQAFSRLRAYARNHNLPPHRCRPDRHRRHPRPAGLSRHLPADSGRIKWLCSPPRWTSCHRYWPVAAVSVCDTRTDTTLARLMITPFWSASRLYLAWARTRLRRSSSARAMASSASLSPAKSSDTTKTSSPPTG
jgi:hypothetical protein